MLGINSQWKPMKALVSFLMAAVLVFSMVGCGDRAPTAGNSTPSGASKNQLAGPISEVSPPEVIQQLRPALDVYKPQVSILSPQADEVLQDNAVEVRLQVQDLPIFKNPELGLGSHLHLILDNQPYQAVYDLNQPLTFKDLSPGTHTLRVFASRPWHESFKNEGAYAQTTFHIFTKTPENNPNSSQPLLTYSRPTGSYGAEPIMLDFYLTNAPLHLVAQENSSDDIADWRIRATVNGQSFVLEKWQPIYLKGFKPGKNWVQLEYIDEQGNPLNNVFNNTARVITYEPNGKDTLSKLVRGDISAEQARGIVDANYKPIPEQTPTPRSEETPAIAPTPTTAPPVEETPPTTEIEPAKPAEPVPTETKQSEKPKPGGFFNRFRRQTGGESSPAPALPATPEVIETPTSSPLPEEQAPQPEESLEPEPSKISSPTVETTPSPTEETVPQPEALPAKQVEPITPPAAPIPTQTKQKEKPKSGGFFNRFRRPSATQATPSPSLAPEPTNIIESPSPEAVPSLPPTLPEIIQTPSEQPVAPKLEIPKQEETPQIEVSPAPSVTAEPTPLEPETQTSNGLLELVPPPGAGKATPVPTLAPTPNSESAAEEELLVPTTASPTVPILSPSAESGIPSRYLKKVAPATKTPEVEE